jgi:hypothetical protein
VYVPVRNRKVPGPGEQVKRHGRDFTGVPVTVLDGQAAGHLSGESRDYDYVIFLRL